MINMLVCLKNDSVIRNILWTGISSSCIFTVLLKAFLKMYYILWLTVKRETKRNNKCIIYTFWHLGLWKHTSTNVKQIRGTNSSPLPISITTEFLTPRKKDCHYLWLWFNPKMICWRLSIKSSKEIGREARSSDSQ